MLQHPRLRRAARACKSQQVFANMFEAIPDTWLKFEELRGGE